MQLTDGNDAFDEIWLFIWIRLVQHPLVAVSGGTGLTCINPRNNHDFILDFFLDAAQS